MLGFVKCLFYIYDYNHVISILKYIDMRHSIYQFTFAEPSIPPWKGMNSLTVNDLFEVRNHNSEGALVCG